MFIAASFMIANNWKQPKYASWMNGYTNCGTSRPVVKRNKLKDREARWQTRKFQALMPHETPNKQ